MGIGSIVKFRLQTASKRARMLAFMAVAALMASALWLSSNFAVHMIKASWSEHRLQELVENTILQAEFAIDNVILAKVDLLSAGHNNCSPETLMAVRSAIYHHGDLVDIQIRGPEETCQAFEEFGLHHDTILAAKDDALDALNSTFRFIQLADELSVGLGVVWEFQAEHYMTSVIRTDGLLFGMLPTAIRDQAELTLSLNNGAVVSQYEPENGIEAGDVHSVSASSQRYPLLVELSMPQGSYNAWHDTPSPILWSASALISILLGFLVALGLVRPPNERDLLKAGLRSDEITPYFQPIISLTTNRIVGCEILARWIKCDGSHVSPGVFIPLAELTGLTDEMTHTLMRQAGRDIGTAILNRPNFKLNINLTAKQLSSPGFTSNFLRHAETCGLSKEQLVVELVERDSMDSLNEVKATLTELQSCGVRVAIDDVGTGQNGLALLQSLEADILKIDKLFVDLINEDASSRAISEMLVGIAQRSDMTLVAEGIEHKEQAETLKEMGINEAQGFHFARPLPASDFLAFLKNDDDLSKAQADLAADDADTEQTHTSSSRVAA
jgi:sensor c-di-GMP phosphodiesterase-like protein